MDGNLPSKRKIGDVYKNSQNVQSNKRGRFVAGDGKENAPVRNVSSSSSDSSVSNNPFDSLSEELIDLVFKFLPRRDLVTRVVLVDWRFQQVTQGDRGTFISEGRQAYQAGDYIEAARYFVNVSPHMGTSDDRMEVDMEEGVDVDFSHVEDARDGLAKCLVKMRFLGNEELAKYSDEALMQLSYSELRALWIDHVEVDMVELSSKSKKDLQYEIYEWSGKASMGSWGEDEVSPHERMYCCERISFLLLHAKDDAVRKDAMIALIRIAREMHGGGDLEKTLIGKSIGNVVSHIAKSGGMEAIAGIMEIVFENVKRSDCSDVAKEALIHALNESMGPIKDELKDLVTRRAELRDALKHDEKVGAEVKELEVVERKLEGYADTIAEVARIRSERLELMSPLFAPEIDGLSQEDLSEQIEAIHGRLEALKGPLEEVEGLRQRRDDLLSSRWLGDATEEEEQELAAIQESLKKKNSIVDEKGRLESRLNECELGLRVLKVDARLDALSAEIEAINKLTADKMALEAKINASESAQELHRVDARIATLNTFVQGVIKKASVHLAIDGFSGDETQGIALRKIFYEGLMSLCLANPENEKTFKKLSEFFGYVISQNLVVTDGECLEIKDYLLELERAHPSAERAQVINVWLFQLGISDIDFGEGLSIADDALVTWLNRITGAKSDVLTEPFPMARIGRLAEALGSPQIKLETRLRLFAILRPHIESLVQAGVKGPDALHIIERFAFSAKRLFVEVDTKESGFDFQKELLMFVDDLMSKLPDDSKGAKAVLNSLRTNIPDLVYKALTAPVLKGD